MAHTYVTFGQAHAHAVNGKTFDKDCVAVITCDSAEEGRALAFELFDCTFCMEYHGEQFDMNDLDYYPRGLIGVN